MDTCPTHGGNFHIICAQCYSEQHQAEQARREAAAAEAATRPPVAHIN